MVKRMTLALVVVSAIAILGWGFWLASIYKTPETVSPPTATLEFWYEMCEAPADRLGFGSCVSGFSPVILPKTFKMSTIHLDDQGRQVIDLHTHYFGAQLNPEMRIVFSINATEPIDFKLVLDNRTEADVHALSDEVAHFSRVIIDAPKITFYYHELNVQEKGLYIFAFDVVQPKPVATVTFEAQYY